MTHRTIAGSNVTETNMEVTGPIQGGKGADIGSSFLPRTGSRICTASPAMHNGTTHGWTFRRIDNRDACDDDRTGT
jgi:hypothetical protein